MLSEKNAVAQRTTWISVATNLLLVGVQLSTGILAHSQALIADAIHSLSDLVADGIVLIANQRSDIRPDADHNYGHSRYETVASFFLGALLVVVGGGMLWHAGLRLADLDQAPTIHRSALWIAVFAIVIKECLFRYMLRQAMKIGSSLMIANAWHARSDAASSLVVALGILGSTLGYRVLDPIAASIVGFMVARMGWSFAWNALQDLSDRALDANDAQQMYATLASTAGVRAVHAFKTRKMGDHVLVDAHLLVDPYITVSEGHYIAETARACLKKDARVLDALIHIDSEDDEQPTSMRIGLPMRDDLLARTRAAMAPYGVPIETIHLHYLSGAIDLDVFLTPRTALPGEPSMPAVCALPDRAVFAHALGVRRVRFFREAPP